MKLDVKSESKSGLQDHVILRVSAELLPRVQAVANPQHGNRKPPEEIRILNDPAGGKCDAIFEIGEEQYYAWLRNLPTVVESWKTKASEDTNDVNDGVHYKSADVGQVLEVSNVRVIPGKSERPLALEELDSGLTPPMLQATERFKRMDRAIKHGLPKDNIEMVRLMDIELMKIVSNLQEAQANSKTGDAQFVYEELVDMEPFMHYWGTCTVIKQGNDNFLSESRKAYDLAWAAYSKSGAHKDVNERKPMGFQGKITQPTGARSMKLVSPTDLPAAPVEIRGAGTNIVTEPSISSSSSAPRRKRQMQTADITSSPAFPLSQNMAVEKPKFHAPVSTSNKPEISLPAVLTPNIGSAVSVREDQGVVIAPEVKANPLSTGAGKIPASLISDTSASPSPAPVSSPTSSVGLLPSPEPAMASSLTTEVPGSVVTTPAGESAPGDAFSEKSNDPNVIRLNEELAAIKTRISIASKAVREAVAKIRGKSLPPSLKKKFTQDIAEKKAALNSAMSEKERVMKELESLIKGQE